MPRELKLDNPVYLEFIELSARTLLQQIAIAVKANKPVDVVLIVRSGIERAYIAGYSDATRHEPLPTVEAVTLAQSPVELPKIEGVLVDGRPIRF